MRVYSAPRFGFATDAGARFVGLEQAVVVFAESERTMVGHAPP